MQIKVYWVFILVQLLAAQAYAGQHLSTITSNEGGGLDYLGTLYIETNDEGALDKLVYRPKEGDKQVSEYNEIVSDKGAVLYNYLFCDFVKINAKQEELSKSDGGNVKIRYKKSLCSNEKYKPVKVDRLGSNWVLNKPSGSSVRNIHFSVSDGGIEDVVLE